MVEPLQGEVKFLAHLGYMLMAWNRVEYWARQHLHQQCQGENILILTAGLGNVTIRDAIYAIANRMPETALAAHLNHFAEYFDILREYRNYYAHGISHVAADKPGEPARAIVMQTVARQRLAIDHDIITYEQLSFVINHCVTLSRYANATQIEYASEGGGTELARKEWPSWPEKPPLPPRLQKTRHALGPLPHLPEASP